MPTPPELAKVTANAAAAAEASNAVAEAPTQLHRYLHERFTSVQLLGAFLVYLLVMQFGYPVTRWGGDWVMGYQTGYALLFVFGALATRQRIGRSVIAVVSALAFIAASVYFVAHPERPEANLIAYAALIPYQLSLIWGLWRFMRMREADSLPDILAAICIYLLVGAAFVPAFGLLEAFAPGSFVDGGHPGAPLAWQQFVYYSYVTLNTVGFGDVRPVSDWARALSNLEALIGVLYVAILITHLLGGIRRGGVTV